MRWISFIVLFLVFIACKKTEEKKESGVVVIASSLRCREKPEETAKVKETYFFGSFLPVSKTEYISEIHGKKANWFYSKKDQCYVFGGFLQEAEYSEILKFRAETIACNIICGGQSCFYRFEPYVAGNRYVAFAVYEDYCMDDKTPCEGIITGRVEKKDSGYIFHSPDAAGAYDSKGNWLYDAIKSNQDIAGIYKDPVTFFEKNDKTGIYYVSGSSVPQRETMREKKCAEGIEEYSQTYYEKGTVQFTDLNQFIMEQRKTKK